MINARAKGRKNELRAKKMLEALGYDVEISRPGQKFAEQVDLFGLWDLVAVRKTDIRCVQVKTNKWPSVVDCESMTLWPCPPVVSKEVWRFRDGIKNPDIRIL